MSLSDNASGGPKASPKISLYRHLFARVDDAYGELLPTKGPISVREPVTDKLLLAHLLGSRHLGFYLIDKDGMADRGIIDVDVPRNRVDIPADWEEARWKVRGVVAVLKRVRIEYYIATSRRRGYHIVIHARLPVPATLIRQILSCVVKAANVSGVECFPKQDKRVGDSGLGNFVFGMLHGASVLKGKTVVVDHSNGFGPLDSWEVLTGVKGNSLETFSTALVMLEAETKTILPLSSSAAKGDRKLPLELLGIGFEQCKVLDTYRWNASETGRLTNCEGTGEHAARIALANYCKVFDGGERWVVDAIFRVLEDYDPVETRKQLASLKGKPPLCSSLCPEGLCDEIKAAGGSSPIKFVVADGRSHSFTEHEDDSPVTVITPPSEVQAHRDPDFPADVMTGAAGAFAHLYSSYMEVPKQFFFMAYLTCLGITLADSLTIDSELKPQPRLFTLLLGESADDRKSTAISKTISFFKDATFCFNVCWGVGSAEGLQKRMEGNNKLLLAFDEFMAFVGKCRIEGSVLLPCVNTLFENNMFESQTKKSEIILNNAHLSILGASTIQTYEKTWSSQFTDIGFNNRLWLVTGKGQRRFSCPQSIPEESKDLAKRKLTAVLDHADKHPILRMGSEAREVYDEWYMGRERTIHWKRLDTYALRFMSLLAVNDLKSAVDVETVRKAIVLCDHQHYVRQLHDPIDADNAVAKLEEKVRRTLKAKGSVGNRELKRALHVNQTGLWLYKTAIDNLIREKEVGFDKSLGSYFLQPEGVTSNVTTQKRC